MARKKSARAAQSKIDQTIEPAPTVEEMESANATASNWNWKRGTWTEASDEWQSFAIKWSNASDADLSQSSQELNIGRVTSCINVPPMIIRECHPEAYALVWNEVVADPAAGVVLTGQPGIGKTMFLWYLLVRLLQRKQVVLFSIAQVSRPLVFFDGRVYIATSDDPYLPEPSSGNRSVFIWSLVDLGERVIIPNLAYSPLQCLPVLTPPPDPARYNILLRSRRATKALFPVWTREELVKGVRMNENYRSITRDLQSLTQTWSRPPQSGNVHDFHELLKPYYAKGRPPPLSKAFDTLLDVIIQEFGNGIQDVVSAMVNFRKIKQHHMEAVEMVGYEALNSAVDSVIHKMSSGTPSDGASDRVLSDHLVCLHPEGEKLGHVWGLDFKSVQIGRAVVQRFQNTELKAHMGELVQDFSSFDNKIALRVVL